GNGCSPTPPRGSQRCTPTTTRWRFTMNFKRKLLIAALPVAFCLSSLAQAATTLKIAEIHPAGYPTVVAMENLGKKLEKATDGEIKYRMFAGGVLGSEKEVVEQVQIGAVQLTRVSLG